ncbi:response regulator transcription factor [Streptomyces vinaceus]|uniref:response regulator transcription factor n=1 Tax=Streptomyces vinaceus TaxID=1960 RepID=UPI00380468A4
MTEPPEAGTRYITWRGLDVLRLMAAGHPNTEIARRLGISINTVKVHTRVAYRMLGANDRAHAVAIAIRLGLIDPHSVPLPEKLRNRVQPAG